MLHSAQEGIYFDLLTNGLSAKYNTCGYLTFHGSLDIEKFRAALQCFWETADCARMKIQLDQHDFSVAHSEVLLPPLGLLDFDMQADAASSALAWMQTRMDYVFEADSFPLMEHALLKIKDGEHWYFVKYHHIVADGYSIAIMFQRVMQAYAALISGKDWPGQQKFSSYQAEIKESHAYLDSTDYEEDAAYWKRRFETSIPPVWPEKTRGSLAADSDVLAMDLPDATRKIMTAVSRDAQVSMLHILLAAVSIFIFRSTGSAQCVTGISLHNRANLKQKNLFGTMVNLILGQQKYQPTVSLRQMLAEIRTQQSDDLLHRRYPAYHLFRHLREKAAIEGAAIRPDFFDLLVNHEKFSGTYSVPGMDVSVAELTSRKEEFPLHVKLCEFGEQYPLVIKVDFCKHRYDRTEIDAMCIRLNHILAQFAEKLDQPVNTIDDGYPLSERAAHYESLQYWKKQLSGAPALLELPTDHPRQAQQEYKAAQLKVVIPKDITEKLQQISEVNQASLSMTVLAVFKILLSRYSGQSELCVASTIVNSKCSETEGLSSSFVNTVVLRSTVNENTSFGDFLMRVRETTLAAYEHRDLPFEQLVEALQPEMQVSVHSLSQVMFGLQDETMDTLESTAASAKYDQGNKCDMSLQLEERAGQLEGSLSYHAGLFENASIERMLKHFQVLLESIANEAGQPITELPMLGAEEQKQLLEEWNDTAVDYAKNQTVHQQFEQQAELHPEHIALVCEEDKLTYRELNAKANQLAHYLRSVGVGPDVLVGLCMERSVEMVVGLLGVLKAGAAYVPLDPGYPPERLAYMLADAQPAVLLTQQRVAGKLPELGDGVKTLKLDTEWALPAAFPLENPATVAAGDNLAYVIYTSGSTGKPKGAGNHHHGLYNRLAWMQQAYGLTSTDRVLQKTPFSFDVSVWEFFWPLAYGSTLVMAKPGGHQDAAYLSSVIRAEAITTMHFVPPMLEVFLNELESHDFPSLRQIICSGQALSLDLQQRFFAKTRNVALHNLYGPTEASIDVSYWQCEQELILPCVPIGKPIANTLLYLLDPYLKPVPVGVKGELYIAGTGLARGYLRRPELSAERFIPNPFSRKGGERMYKTGDLARYLADGNIDYLGRIDEQVKLRGLRIELGEIEAALNGLAGIREAVVLLREDSPGDKRLVAYVVTAEAMQDDAIRVALGHSLPDYMLPSHFVMLQRLPLTPNGKVDKKALPAPDKSRNEAGYVAPVSDTEILLAGIWAEVLKVDKVGLRDNFFALGGDSLLATQVISRLHKACQIDLPVRSLFETRNMAALADRIENAQKQQATGKLNQLSPNQLSPIEAVPRDQPLPLSYAQQRLWFIDQYDPGSAAYNVPCAIRLQGELQQQALEASLNAIVQRHESLRTRFILKGDLPVQQIAASQALTVELIDLTDLPKAEREVRAQMLILDEANTRFDLATGPLIRARLLKLGATEHIFLFTLHHIVSDGWSMGILLNELAQLYAAQLQGTPAQLPVLPIQYADFAHWQKAWLQGEVLEKQLNYWKTQLAGAPGLLELPTDYPRPAQQGYNGAQVRVEIKQDITEQLHQISQANQASLFMSLAAAFKILLSRYSGQTDLCIGSGTANRNRGETEGLIGFFINTLVLRSEVNENLSFSEFLQQVRETTLAAYEHQDIPFEQLVEVLQPQRHTSHSPLFQVSFMLQNAPMGTLELPGLTLDTLESSAVSAKFDLSLQLEEKEGQIEGHLIYNTDLFENATIERMVGHYQRLLQAVLADPAACLSEISMLTAEEQKQVLEDWNDTGLDDKSVSTVQQLFEEQAELYPDNIAVVYEEDKLTYQELNARANQLAHLLRNMGVGPNVMVGLCLERSAEMLIAVLAILKAGGAYVPLDPSYPPERLSYLLKDSAPSVLITQDSLQDDLPVSSLSRMIVLDEAAILARLRKQPTDNLGAIAGQSASGLANVIYTSGSTGQPKGVMVGHAGIINLARHQSQAFEVVPQSRVLLFASLSFDAATSEWAMALSSGASLYVCTDAQRKDPALLQDFLLGQHISHATLPSAVLCNLDSQPPYSLVSLIAAGEACEPSLVQTWAEKCKFFNAYGPTETTVCASQTQLYKDSPLSIGRPIANIRIYLLDRHLKPVPVGVKGELYIAGVGLTHGYLRRPELSAERFIPNPFAKQGGERMYRSGDLARYLPDGNIDYLGRIDDQVKLRGFRIELGEIEAVLSAQAGIREAVVMVREDNPGDKRLVAYVVTAEAIQEDTIRLALGRSLPDYMLPSHFVTLERLPLTPNSKVDKKALPSPDSNRNEASYVAPVSETEILLAGIWADVLKVDKIGLHDNFFVLGGHSLLAITLIEKMRRADFHIDVRTLFTTPTIAALVAVFAQAGQGGHSKHAVQVPPNGIPPGCTVLQADMLPLLSLSAAELHSISSQAPGGVANIQDIYPLSPLQEGIVFHYLMNDSGDAYLSPTLLAFDSKARLDSFTDALQQVIARHDILRTAVLWEGLSEPVQVVLRDAQIQIHQHQLRAEDGDIGQQLSALYDPRHYRLDIRQAPLLGGGAALDQANGRWLLLLLLHHLAIDHTTLELLIQEVQSFMHGQEHSLPAPEPFRNFVAQARLGVSQEEHTRFFSNMLGHITEGTLPFGLANVQGDGGGIKEVKRAVDKDLARKLRQQARQLAVSPASLMHLAWAQVLARLSGQEQVVFGTVLFGRMQGLAASERTMGMFINTLPVCIAVDGCSVQDSLEQTHHKLIELLRHEHASLALAQRCSGVAAPAPLFSAMLNYRYNLDGQTDTSLKQLVDANNATDPTENSPWPGITLLSTEERTNYPVCLSIDDLGQDFVLTAQVVDKIPAQRICDYMHTALENLSYALEHTKGCPVTSIEVLPAAERQQLLYEWNDTSQECGTDLTVPQLFEAQAERTPDHIAVVYEEGKLTYRELNEKANQLAHHLRTLGVGPDVLVAISVERSLEMLIGLLAILKAGGAYVPLDPAYPPERLAYMLGDAKPAVLLTQNYLLKVFSGLTASMASGISAEIQTPGIFCLDSQWAELEQYSRINPEHVALASNLAYVIYTSGSTGLPKGTQLMHNNVTRLFATAQAHFGFNANDTWCLFHSYAFDFSVWEIWGALLYGGKLVIVPYMVSRSPDQFLSLLIEQGVTVLNQTPSAFAQLVAAEPHAKPSGLQLRYVIFGGEALNQQALLPWFDRHGYVAPSLINMYGITETTVHVTYLMLQQEIQTNSCIGKPLADLTCYILDRNQNPVPVGVAGELHIAGAGLARGYLNRAELTAEKFIPNPFSPTPGTRMYRSGDLARYLPDGNIDYLGRIDDQVKLRGFRIEIGEIEAVLSAQPDVREAVVIVREDSPGDKRLVAYIVMHALMTAEEEHALQEEVIRTALGNSLPSYMVPSHFVMLECLPLTPNGKVDKKALPAPDRNTNEASYVAPVSEIEILLAGIWADVLKVDRIGLHDNFFSLGGHSLLAITLIEKMRRADFHVDVRTLFTTPTIAALVTQADHHRQSSYTVQVPPNGIPPGCTILQPDMLPLVSLTAEELQSISSQVPGGAANIQDIYPLAPLQEGFVFHHLMNDIGDPYLSLVQLAFDSKSRLDSFAHALQKVIKRHDVLRTAVVWEGVHEPVQVVLRDVPIQIQHHQFPVEDGGAESGDISQKLNALYDPRHYRINFQQASMLFGASAHDLAKNRWLFLFMHHHFAVDNRSLELLIQEIHIFMHGQEHKLPAPEPFRNFVAQARLAVSQEEHMRFFNKLLSHVNEPTLPFGFSNVQGDGCGIQEAIREVDKDLARKLRQQARQMGVSTASLMHQAWAHVLARLSGQEEVVFGTVLFGRMQGGVGADRTVGLFINTLPVCIAVNGRSAQGSVEQTHRQLIDLLRHEHASLALAQRCSGVAAPTPLFSALLNYRYSSDGATDISQRNLRNTIDSTESSYWPGITLLSAEELTNYPVCLSVDDLGQGFVMTAQVIDKIPAQRICDYMHTALENLSHALEHAPGSPAAGIDVLPVAEQQQLLHDWNDSRLDYATSQTVQQLFEVQVERTPEHVALVFEDDQLTYRALNEKANQLAHYLRSVGVGPDVLVGVCVERSLDMVVSLLAILKAGGAYVPLDPGYPQERLAYMLADARPAVLLTQACVSSKLPDNSQTIKTLRLDTEWARAAACPRSNPLPVAAGDNLAYIIYTSGSTGKPKGVMISCASIARHILACIDRYEITAADHVLQFASSNFDPSIEQIFSCLGAGARLIIRGRAAWSAEELCEQIQREKISVANIPGAYWNPLANVRPGLSALPSLRLLIMGGEAILTETSKQIDFQCVLMNAYGPTETTVTASTFRIEHASDIQQIETKYLSIGQAFANQRMYVLDAQLNPVPMGVTGELHIAGPCLARAYLNRPDLTAEKFIPDPFASNSGGRMYKTGDLARYLPDGQFEFLGRRDEQVKIRGFRIEIGEVEAALSALPSVREAIVIAREDHKAEKCLVAYIVPHQFRRGESIVEMRTMLARILPDYMIPAYFVEMEAMPLNPNGKIDRHALPLPQKMLASEGHVAPRTATESMLANIWSEVLKHDEPGIYDNFFGLGGHSLLATQVLTKIRQQCQIDFALRVLFELQTIAQLAPYIDELLEERDAAVVNEESVFSEIADFIGTLKLD